MARLFSCGFEEGNVKVWEYYGAGSAASATPRNGTYSFGGINTINLGKLLPSTYTEIYFRAGVRISNGGSCIQFREGTGVVHIGVYMYPGASGTINIYRGGSIIHTITGIPFFALFVWHCIEVYVKIDDTVGRVIVVQNGDYSNPLVDFTGDTKNGGTGVIDNFNITQGTAQASVWDDIAINDTSGAVNNSWCGDGYGKLLPLNDNGDVSQLVGSDADSTDNYLLVNDVPYDTPTYVESDTPDEYDLYNVTAPALAANEVVNSVRIGAVGMNDVEGEGGIKVGIKTAAEDWSGATVMLTSATYIAAQGFYSADPADSAAWSEAKLNTLQVGVKVV